MTIPIYYGFDPREEYGGHVFCSSVIHRSSLPVSLIPLHADLFASFWGRKQSLDETNAFTRTRFLIPFLQDFKGWAIFCDGSDMLCRDDIGELWDLRDEYKAVHVVAHDYKTTAKRKYIGTAMEAENRDYPRKNQSSVMLINCKHFAWRQMTPETVEKLTGAELHQFAWIAEDRIGYLPKAWNHLVGEEPPNPDAKIAHFTLGGPWWPAYRDCEFADEWAAAALKATHVTA
jgi:lipopolysaccharide biosynthesis glycosyltransferase